MKIEVDLSKIYNNARLVKKLAKTEICAVVKADGYGHNAVAVAHELKDIVFSFAVARYSEAKKLVDSGIKKDILILGNEDSNGVKNVIPTIISKDDLYDKIKRNRYNLAINTGMNRLGINAEELDSILPMINNVYSVFSHVYSIESMDDQTNRFDDLLYKIKGQYYKHLYASNCLFAKKQYDFARVGLALYGYGFDGLKPAMTVYSKVIRIDWVKAGSCVGYGNNVLISDVCIATVDAGYRDGFCRLKDGETRFVGINGKKRKVIGQVCMDMFMCEADRHVKVGDTVYLLGDIMKMEEISHSQGTVAYEILTQFQHREDIIFK